MAKTKNLTVYDRIYKHLFDEKGSTKLSDADYTVKQRVQAIFTKKIDNPTIPDRTLVNFLCNQFGIQKSAAYNDIMALETIYGNLKKANKEHIRLIVTEELKEVIQTEKIRLQLDIRNDRDPDGNLKTGGSYKTDILVNALSAMARANNLDKEDPNTPNWEDVQPPIIEPTDDITIMDLEAVPDGTIQRLKEKYLGKMSDIQEAEVVK